MKGLGEIIKNNKELWYYVTIGILVATYIIVALCTFFHSGVAFDKRLSLLMTMISSSLSILISVLVASLAATKQIKTYEKQKKLDKINKWNNMRLLVELELGSNREKLLKYINKEFTNVVVLQQTLGVKLWENSIEYIAYGDECAKELFETYQKLSTLKTMDSKGVSDKIVKDTFDRVENTLSLIKEDEEKQKYSNTKEQIARNEIKQESDKKDYVCVFKSHDKINVLAFDDADALIDYTNALRTSGSDVTILWSGRIHIYRKDEE